MCDPVTLSLVAGGAQIAQTVQGYNAQRKAADNARETIHAQQVQNYKALADRRIQEEQATAQQTMAAQRQARLAQGSQMVSAGARGVAGRSTSILLQNVEAQQARALEAIRANNDFQETAFYNQQRSIELTGQASLLGAAQPAFPIFGLINNIAGAGASILGAPPSGSGMSGGGAAPKAPSWQQGMNPDLFNGSLT